MTEAQGMSDIIGPCPRCNNELASVRYRFDDARIARCAACTLLYIDPWPDPDATEAVYSENYFENNEFLEGNNKTLYGYNDYVAERANKQPQYAQIARDALSLLPPLAERPRLLEVGCGFGYFLDEAFEAGFEPTGVEFNPHAVSRLRMKYAFPISEGAIEAAVFDQGSFDVVTMFDVIEHLRDPFVSLDKIYDALAPGGLMIITTPDAGSWVSRLIGDRLEDFRRTREHLFFFTRKTLGELLSDHGFDVLEMQSIGHTFDLSHLLSRLELYNRPIFATLGRLLNWIGLGSLQLYVNPRTKMIATARKRGAPGECPKWADLTQASGQDRTLVEELETLDNTTPRHYEWIIDTIRPFLGRSVLEIGSGIGVISKHLISQCDSLHLTDYKDLYLDILRTRFGELPHVKYRKLDLNETPYELGDQEIDTIVCLNVLEHIEDDDAVLRGLADLLPSGGKLLLQVPNYPRLFGTLDESYGHYRRYAAKALRAQLEDAGFSVRLLRRFNPFSIPSWILSGMILKQRRLNVASLTAYDRVLPLLRKLDFMSRFAGISLIVVAERR